MNKKESLAICNDEVINGITNKVNIVIATDTQLQIQIRIIIYYGFFSIT